MQKAQNESDPVLGRIASEVGIGRADFVTQLVRVTESEVGGLQHNARVRSLLTESISQNVDRLLVLLRSGDDPRAESPPTAALDYARTLARSEASLAALLRAYRIGQASFTAHCLQVAADLEVGTAAVQIALVNVIAAYLDHVCEQVAEAYEGEHTLWISGHEGLRQQWVSRLLGGADVELGRAEAALGYPLIGHHLAAEMWTTGDADDSTPALRRAVADLHAAVGARARLVMPRSHRHVRVWFCLPGPEPVERALAPLVDVRLAVGPVAFGIKGFRSTQARAARVRELMLLPGGAATRCVHWDQVAWLGLISASPEELRLQVDASLGVLSAVDPRTAELRETLRVYLEVGRNDTAAAEVLHVHRNTVRYRVRQALQLCERPLDPNVFDLLAALHVARWIG